MNLEKVAVALFEHCQDKSKTVAMTTEALIVEQFGFFPNNKEAVEDVVRKYRNSGTGLEACAQEIINLMGGKVETPAPAVDTGSTPDLSKGGPSAAVYGVKLENNYAVKDGVVVNLAQEKATINAVDSTRPEIAGVALSESYLNTRIKELFGNDKIYDVTNLGQKITKQGRVFDLALVQLLPDDKERGLMYSGVKYSGWDMKTDEEREADNYRRQVELETNRAKRQKAAEERDQLIESLGLTKFDEPEKAFELYCALKEKDENFVFDINLLEEDCDGHTFFYDEEEYKIHTDDEISDMYYEQEVEYIRDNPHDYVYDACYSEMVERVYCYDSDVHESDNGQYYVIKE